MRAVETTLIVAAIVLPLFVVLIYFGPAIGEWLDLRAAEEVRAPLAVYSCKVRTGDSGRYMTYPPCWQRTEDRAIAACRENDLHPIAVLVWEDGKDRPYERPPH